MRSFVGAGRGSGPGDRDERVETQAHVAVPGGEVSIHDFGPHIDSQAAAGRHAFASVAGEIHEQPLDPFNLSLDVQWRRRVADLDLDMVTGETFQNRFEIAYQRVQVDELRRARLFLAERRQLMQETGCAPDFVDEQFTLLPDINALASREPLPAVLVNVVQEGAAGHGHLRSEPADGFHPVRLIEPLLEDTQTRQIFDDDLDRVGGQQPRQQANVQAAAIVPPPRRLDRFLGARAHTALDQPRQRIWSFKDNGSEVRRRLLEHPPADQCRARSIRVDQGESFAEESEVMP